MAGSLEAVSAEYCLGEECSHVVRLEVGYTTAIPRMRIPVVRWEEDELAVSRIAPDAPSHNRRPAAPVNDLGPVQDRAGEARCPRIAWAVRAMMKRWVYAAQRDRADAPSQERGNHTAVVAAAAAAAVAVDASKTFQCLSGISASLRRRAGDPSQDRAFLDHKAAVSHRTRTWAAAHRVGGDTEG